MNPKPLAYILKQALSGCVAANWGYYSQSGNFITFYVGDGGYSFRVDYIVYEKINRCFICFSEFLNGIPLLRLTITILEIKLINIIFLNFACYKMTCCEKCVV